MSEEERLQHLAKLYKESEKIKKKFTSLTFNLQEHLEKNSKLEKVVNLLIFYDDTLEEELRMCDSITLVFHKIRKFISFYDYELIKILAKHLGSRKLKKKFSEYKMSFQNYAKCHLCQCPSDLFESDSNTETNYIIKIEDKSVEKLTMEQLKVFQLKMSEILGQKLLKLVKVEKGCVQVTFRTFSCSDFVFSDEQQRTLSRLGVVTISCGSESIHIPPLSSLKNKS